MRLLGGIVALAALGLSSPTMAENGVELFRGLTVGMSEEEVAAKYEIRKPGMGEKGIGEIGTGRHRYLREKVQLTPDCEGKAKLTFYKEEKVQRLNHVIVHNYCDTPTLLELLTAKYGEPVANVESRTPVCIASALVCAARKVAYEETWTVYRWNVDGVLITFNTDNDDITYSAGVSADFKSEI